MPLPPGYSRDLAPVGWDKFPVGFLKNRRHPFRATHFMTPARLVLVEDHAMMRQMLRAFIGEQSGLQLVADCTSIGEGAEIIKREDPDLVILDCRLPDGSGLDLVRQLKPETPRLKWLVLSGTENGRLVNESVTLGVQGFVHKSTELNTLSTAISSILSGAHYYCSKSSQLLVDTLLAERQLGLLGLTGREIEILRSFARGQNLKTTAAQLGISVKTAQNHLTSLKDKLGLYEPAELVHYAIQRGLVGPN